MLACNILKINPKLSRVPVDFAAKKSLGQEKSLKESFDFQKECVFL